MQSSSDASRKIYFQRRLSMWYVKLRKNSIASIFDDSNLRYPLINLYFPPVKVFTRASSFAILSSCD